MIKRLGCTCKVPIERLDFNDVWVCPRCRQWWRCREGPWTGSKYPERVTWWQWLFGLDGSD